MSKNILLLLFLLLIPFVGAVKLGVSNSELEFNMSVNEELCRRIGIGTDHIGTIVSELKFAKNPLDNQLIGNYQINPNYFKIIPKYKKEINFETIGNKEVELCLIGKNSGNYRGIFLIKTKENNAAIGIFIKANIKEQNNKNIGLILTPTILLGFLLFLLIKRLEKSSK